MLYATPALLFVLAFTVYPLGQLIYTSMTSTSLLGGGRFVGLANYTKAFGDSTFWSALMLHAEIHHLHHADPDGGRLPAGSV